MSLTSEPTASAPAGVDALTRDTPIERVAVIGTGYVGLTSAACLAHLGRHTTAIDIDEEKVAALRAGGVTISEAGIDQLLAEATAAERLHFNTDHEACRSADAVLLCLPTPHGGHAGPDLSAVQAACRQLGPLLRPGALVLTKSTVPPGTHALVAGWLDRTDVAVVANPEFLREGVAVDDFLNPDRIVIGASTEAIGRRAASLYRGVDAPIVFTDPMSAELIKYAANTFLATKLSFVNEISRLCHHLGADIDHVVAGLGSDARIGPGFLQPGPGWGGSCFPKDTRGLAHVARSRGQYLPVIEAAYESNRSHVEHIVDQILECLPPAPDRRVAVWGAAFKAGTDDVRESPALAVADRLAGRGVDVVVHDPVVDPGSIAHPMVDGGPAACAGADLLVVATEWPEYATADLSEVARRLRRPLVFDTRAVIDADAAALAGLTVLRPGRRS